MKKLKIINVVFGSLFIIFMLIFLLTGSDGICGYTARIVISGSMEPAIPVYTVNIVKKCDISDVSEGDIILYRYKSDIIHRVIAIDNSDTGIILITQGDANESPDMIDINSDMFIGKVVRTLFWTKHILGPIKGGSRASIQLFIIVCILAIYIIYILVKRYVKIYCIYAHNNDGNKHCKGKNIKEIYADSKSRWKKAETEYLANSAIEENRADNNKYKQ